MLNLTTLQAASLAIILFIVLMAGLAYMTLWATPRTEEDPEIPEKSGYLAEVARIDEERL